MSPSKVLWVLGTVPAVPHGEVDLIHCCAFSG